MGKGLLRALEGEYSNPGEDHISRLLLMLFSLPGAHCSRVLGAVWSQSWKGQGPGKFPGAVLPGLYV